MIDTKQSGDTFFYLLESSERSFSSRSLIFFFFVTVVWLVGLGPGRECWNRL